MGQVLDSLIDKVLKNDEKIFIAAPKEDKEKYQQSLKETFISQIKEEIIKEEAEKFAEEIIKSKKAKKIEEIKSTILTGVCLSFFLGLIVNQVTDIIGYLKGSVSLEKLDSTLWILFWLGLITVAILFYLFIENVLKFLNKNEDKNERNTN